MTLPKNVEDAVKSFDGWLDFIFAEYSGHESEWQTIRTELHRLTDRLEAADALLHSMREGAFNIGGWADDIDEYFDAHNSAREVGE